MTINDDMKDFPDKILVCMCCGDTFVEGHKHHCSKGFFAAKNTNFTLCTACMEPVRPGEKCPHCGEEQVPTYTVDKEATKELYESGEAAKMLASAGFEQPPNIVADLGPGTVIRLEDGETIEDYQKKHGIPLETYTDVFGKETCPVCKESVQFDDNDRCPICHAHKSGEGASKEKSNKIRFDLVPVRPHMELAKVYTYGARGKYDDWNWEKGLPYSDCLASLERHFLAVKGGEDINPESGLYHLAHLMWWCCTLMEYYRLHPELDDRRVTEIVKDMTYDLPEQPTKAR